MVVFALCVCAQARNEVDVFPAEKGVQINRFFYDFKSPSAAKKFDKKQAKQLLDTYGFNGIRTPIYGNAEKPAHPGPGVVLEEYYESETKGLKLAKKIRPDILIFASKKLDGTDSFPDWTKNDRGVIPKKYAVLLADYLGYMEREGLPVDVLGIDNERKCNEGNIMPAVHRDIVLELRKLTEERGLHMPKIIGPEDFAVGRDNWMRTFKENDGWGDTLDIFGDHYYPERRKLAELKSDLKYAGDREKWHTELHWDSKDKQDPMEAAVAAILAVWDSTDNGMNGLMWWAFSEKDDLRGSLMHAVTLSLVNAWPVKATDPDGSDTVDEMKLHTRAFLKGDTLTIYALNLDSSKKWKDLNFNIEEGQIVGTVDSRQWSDNDPDEGKAVQIEPSSFGTFCATLAPGTISIFSMKYVP